MTQDDGSGNHSEDDVPVYTPDGPPRPSPEDLRARIPGWGVDLDPADRPSYPKLRLQPDLTGAHWRFPERQPERSPRERSIEHRFLTPVFGTAQPAHGLSGRVRRLAYARWSEARNAHWLALIVADRIDVHESAVNALLHGRPRSFLDSMVAAGPWLLSGCTTYVVVRRLARRGGR